MKRASLFVLGLIVLAAAPACRREDRVGTTNTTSAATVTPAERPNVAATAPALATAEPTQASIDVSSLPDAPRAGATSSAANGTSNSNVATGAIAAGAGGGAAATSTAAVDISGPTPAANTNAGTLGGTATGTVAAPFGNANGTSTTTTTGAPLVTPGLDNGVTGGVGNAGAPFNYASPMSTSPRPVGGAMRPGAAGNPDTTSGAR